MVQLAASDKRAAMRKRMLKTASIVISDKAPKLECTLRNISETAALLQVLTTLGIPFRFDVIIDGVCHHCRSVWRNDSRMGIAFQ